MTISLVGTISKGWVSKALGIIYDYDYYFDPCRRYKIDQQCQGYVVETFPDLNIFYSESNLGRLKYYSSEQVLIGGIQPNMILGMLLGAEFVPNDEFDADISLTCLKDAEPDDLPSVESLLEHNLVKLFDEQIQTFRTDSHSSLRPIPPFFWDNSGRAAIHGIMTSAQKFFGEDFFLDMLANPEKCHKIMAWISDAYIVLVKHFSELADFPFSGIHIGECSACMIDPDSFDQFVVPATSRVGQAIGPLRLHSCGCSTHIIKSAQKITNLYTLDVGGETSVATIRSIFGKEFPLSIAPMATAFSSKTSKPIIDWAEQILEENQGGEMQIVYHLEPNYSLDIVMELNDYIPWGTNTYSPPESYSHTTV